MQWYSLINRLDFAALPPRIDQIVDADMQKLGNFVQIMASGRERPLSQLATMLASVRSSPATISTLLTSDSGTTWLLFSA